MSWLILVLTLFTALANLGDFLFGDKSVESVREAILHLYMAIEDKNWRRVYQAPADLLSIYAAKLMGRQKGLVFVVFRLLLLATVLNAFMSCILLLHFYNTDDLKGLLPPGAGVIETFLLPQIRLMAFALPGNLLGDVLAWTTFLFLISRLRFAGPALAIALLSSAFAVLYLIVALAVGLRSHLMIVAFVYGSPWTAKFFRGMAETNPGLSWWSIVVHPSIEDFVAIAQVTLPMMLFISVSTLGLLLYSLRKVIHRPLSFILERIDASPKNALTLAAAVFSAVAAVIAAWIKASSR